MPRAPSFVLGLGLGGFVDGIVLHQLLQWHHMVSGVDDHPMDTLRGLQDNTLADGLFHSATWLLVVTGTILMFRAWRDGRIAPPWGWHLGWLLAGWGAFNLFDGVVDHHLLGLHHIRDDLGGPLGWDIGFDVLAIAQLATGIWLARRSAARAAAPAG